VLIPANRFTAVHGGVAHAVGMRFGCMVMDKARDDTFANADEVLKTVDLMIAAEMSAQPLVPLGHARNFSQSDQVLSGIFHAMLSS
jgi:hypothetical protein